MTSAMIVGVPCFFSDGFSCYLTALIEVYHQLKVFPPTGKPGHHLVYGQVVKKKKKGHRLKELVYQVLCGAERMKELGLKISTSLIERLNLTLRASIAPLVRKTGAFCKDQEWMRKRVEFFHVFYNFARLHMSLRLALSEPEKEPLGIIKSKWIPQTPAMAAGLSDHVWTFRKLLTAKFEPIYNQSTSG